MNRLLLVAAAAALTLAGAPAPAAQAELTQEQISQYMEAVGFATISPKVLKAINGVCVGAYADLRAGADKAMAGWSKRNQSLIDKAGRLQNRVLAEIGRLDGPDAVKSFEQMRDQRINDEATGMVKQVEALPDDKKSRLCHQHVSSIGEGRWDIKNQNPAVYKTLIEYTDAK